MHIMSDEIGNMGKLVKAEQFRDMSSLQNTNKLQEHCLSFSKITGEDGVNHHEVQARLAILDKQFKTAESIYLDYNNLGAAMEMYQELHKWDEGRLC